MAASETRTPIKRTRCPNCEHRLDAAVVADNPTAQAKPDDFAICKYCGCVMAYDQFMRIRPLTPEEASVAERHPAIQSLVRMVRTRAEHDA